MITLPTHVTDLYLGYIKRYCKTTSEIIQALKAIPNNVEYLDLRNNFAWGQTADELAAIAKAIPAGVTSLDLTDTYNALGNITGDKLTRILSALSLNVKSVIIESETINLDKYRHEQIITLNSAVESTTKPDCTDL